MTAHEREKSPLGRAIAELEAVDATLAALPAAQAPAADGNPPSGPIPECRALLRAAIAALAAAQASGDDTGSGKRRVKIKAASESTTPSEPARAATTPSRAGTGAKPNVKAGARRGGERPLPSAEQETNSSAPANSLLARLGAAAAPPAAAAPVVTEAAPAPESQAAAIAVTVGDVKGISAEDAVDRLARLEAEIASLTETAPATGARSVGKRAPSPPPQGPAPPMDPRSKDRAPTPPHSQMDSDVPDDEEDAEIVIVGSDGPTAGRGASPERHGPRIYRDAVPPADDDAEVEIVRPGEETRAVRGSASSANAAKATAPAKWRLFRGSR